MSPTDDRHALVERVPADKVERAPVNYLEYKELMRQRWKQGGDRVGLDVD